MVAIGYLSLSLTYINNFLFNIICWQATIEHRKLAVDLSEVIIKWEIQYIKEETDAGQEVSSTLYFILYYVINISIYLSGIMKSWILLLSFGAFL